MAIQALTKDWAQITLAAASKIQAYKGPIYIDVAATVPAATVHGRRLQHAALYPAGTKINLRGPGYYDIVTIAQV